MPLEKYDVVEFMMHLFRELSDEIVDKYVLYKLIHKPSEDDFG